ncbi:Polyamine oxidase 1 [Linum grandiflorum]
MAMVFILLLISLLFTASTAADSPSVIVIGAGMSGISAAKKLYDAGIKDILILEGTSRIGGRMLKTDFSGYTVEMGANWFFSGGPVANPVIEMAKQVNLKSYPNDYSNITANAYKQEGGMYMKKEVEQVDEVAVARDEYCAKLARLLSRQSKKKDVDVSILAGQRLYGRPPLTPLEMVIDFYHNDYEDAEPPKVTSLRHTYPRTEFEEHGEDPHFVTDPRGFGVLVQYLAGQILTKESPVRLKLKKVVTEIVYDKKNVTVKTEDGSTYSADYAVVSASVGVLQTDLIKFKPKLPMWKRMAISDMTMTIYTKIFMKFPHKFWPSGNGTEFFLYTHVQRGYYPLWQHLDNEYPGSNILMVTVTADESRRVEQLSNEAIQGEAMAVLKKMFGEKIPNPENILVPRWGSNRFYKGSYSNWPANYNQEKHDQLGAPVGAVYFTGEHNSNKFIGYVDGAYLEGIATAEALIKCIKGEGCQGENNMSIE